MYAPVVWICNTFLARQTGGFEQLGLYHASFAFQVGLRMVGEALAAPLMPILMNYRGAKKEKFERLNMLLNWIFGIVPILPLFCFPEIIDIVYKEKFSSQSLRYSFLLVLFSSSILLYKQGLARALQVHNMMWWGLSSNLFWAAILLIIAYSFIHWGAVGLAFALASSYFLNTIVFLPLYLLRGLVPKDTIISRESLSHMASGYHACCAEYRRV